MDATGDGILTADELSVALPQLKAQVQFGSILANMLEFADLNQDSVLCRADWDQYVATLPSYPDVVMTGFQEAVARIPQAPLPQVSPFLEPMASPATKPQADAAPAHLREPVEAVDYNSVDELLASTRQGALAPLSGKYLVGLAKGWRVWLCEVPI